MVHEMKRDFKCDSCGKSFLQKGDLNNHLLSVHERRQDHQCKSCPKAFFFLKANLTKHFKRVHKDSGGFVTCTQEYLAK